MSRSSERTHSGSHSQEPGGGFGFIEGPGLGAKWRVPLQAVAEWVADYRRFWDRNLDSLGAHLKTMQRKARRERKAK
jgi:hypothetical protein